MENIEVPVSGGFYDKLVSKCKTRAGDHNFNNFVAISTSLDNDFIPQNESDRAVSLGSLDVRNDVKHQLRHWQAAGWCPMFRSGY